VSPTWHYTPILSTVTTKQTKSGKREESSATPTGDGDLVANGGDEREEMTMVCVGHRMTLTGLVSLCPACHRTQRTLAEAVAQLRDAQMAPGGGRGRGRGSDRPRPGLVVGADNDLDPDPVLDLDQGGSGWRALGLASRFPAEVAHLADINGWDEGEVDAYLEGCAYRYFRVEGHPYWPGVRVGETWEVDLSVLVRNWGCPEDLEDRVLPPALRPRPW
jgi:hypothetical protein